MNNFSDWLQAKMEQNNLTQAELARMANISQASISHIISGRRSPGSDVLEAIARALRIPTESVYRAAGLLPQVPARNEQIERILNFLDQLPPDELDRAEVLISALSQRRVRTGKTGPLRGQT